MRHFMTACILVLSALGLLGGCGGPESSGQIPQSLAISKLLNQSYRVSFFEDRTDHSIQTSDGLKLSEFLQNLRQDPPGYLRLQPRGTVLSEEKILQLLEQSDLYRYSAVDIAPAAPARAEESSVLEIELTYYAYTLQNCGAHLDRRLIDHETWKTPGFGCAVNHNRLVSLVRPGNARSGGYLAPALARSQVKAINTYQALPPTPFPPASK